MCSLPYAVIITRNALPTYAVNNHVAISSVERSCIHLWAATVVAAAAVAEVIYAITVAWATAVPTTFLSKLEC